MRRLTVFLVVLMGMLGLVAPPALAAGSRPVLGGRWGPFPEGYGHAMPVAISNGGALGRIRNIEWLAWGGTRAVGIGVGFWITAGPGETAAAISQSTVVVAFKLGMCKGRRAYDAVTSYFPEHGEQFNPNKYRNSCPGETHE
jgi:hypothetical protein